jgi:hypothetical protein
MKLSDKKGPTIYGLLMAFIASLVLVCSIWWANSYARDRLNLAFSVEIQYRPSMAAPWNPVKKLTSEGLSAIQFHLDSINEYRMVLKVSKPHDIKGEFKARMITRTDGVVVPPDSSEGTIIFGPHKGCTDELGNRCKPLGLSDVGLVELRLDLEKAVETAIGAFSIRPYDNPSMIAVRPSIRYKETQIECNSSVDKGWWIFAKKFIADSTPISSISLCVTTPKSKVKCSKDLEFQLKVKANEKGPYKFTLWNEKGVKRECIIFAK